jgi:hypothetical protein
VGHPDVSIGSREQLGIPAEDSRETAAAKRDALIFAAKTGHEKR